MASACAKSPGDAAPNGSTPPLSSQPSVSNTQESLATPPGIMSRLRAWAHGTWLRWESQGLVQSLPRYKSPKVSTLAALAQRALSQRYITYRLQRRKRVNDIASALHSKHMIRVRRRRLQAVKRRPKTLNPKHRRFTRVPPVPPTPTAPPPRPPQLRGGLVQRLFTLLLLLLADNVTRGVSATRLTDWHLGGMWQDAPHTVSTAASLLHPCFLRESPRLSAQWEAVPFSARIANQARHLERIEHKHNAASRQLLSSMFTSAARQPTTMLVIPRGAGGSGIPWTTTTTRDEARLKTAAAAKPSELPINGYDAAAGLNLSTHHPFVLRQLTPTALRPDQETALHGLTATAPVNPVIAGRFTAAATGASSSTSPHSSTASLPTYLPPSSPLLPWTSPGPPGAGFTAMASVTAVGEPLSL